MSGSAGAVVREAHLAVVPQGPATRRLVADLAMPGAQGAKPSSRDHAGSFLAECDMAADQSRGDLLD